MKKLVTLTVETLQSANLPRRYWKLGWDTHPGSRETVVAALNYLRHAQRASDNGMGLLFQGQPQSCKTFLLVQVLKLLLARGYSASYTTLDELTDIHLGRAEGPLETMFDEAEFLGIDGVNQPLHKGQVNALARVLRRRHDHGQPFLAATELCSEEGDALEDAYGKRIAEYFRSSTVTISCHASRFKLLHLEQERRKPFIPKETDHAD